MVPNWHYHCSGNLIYNLQFQMVQYNWIVGYWLSFTLRPLSLHRLLPMRLVTTLECIMTSPAAEEIDTITDRHVRTLEATWTTPLHQLDGHRVVLEISHLITATSILTAPMMVSDLPLRFVYKNPRHPPLQHQVPVWLAVFLRGQERLQLV